MFSKNIKTLSLFLVLVAVMIVAVGAVSAADVSTGSVTNVTVDYDQGTGAANVDLSGAGTVHINGTVSTIDDQGDKTNNVPAGTVLNATATPGATQSQDAIADTKPAITNDGFIYSYNGTAFVKTGATVSTSVGALSDAGVYDATLTISSSSALTDGSTYYVNIIIPANAAAYVGTLGSSGDSNFTYLKVAQSTFVPFTYEGPNFALNTNETNITFGDDWSFTGTLVDANGKPIVGQSIKVVLNQGTATAIDTVDGKIVTNSTGQFTLDSALWKSLATSTKTLPSSTTPYTFTFTANTYNQTANVNVAKKNATIEATANATTINVGDKISLNATVVDANGNLINTSTITLSGTYISKNGQTGNITFNTVNDNGVYTLNKFDKALTADVYYITLNGAADPANYNIKSASNIIVLTVKDIETNIVPTTETINTTTDILGSSTAGNLVTINSNTTTNKTDLDGAWTGIIYNQDGTPVKTITTLTNPSNTLTVKNTDIGSLSEGNYYMIITYNPSVDGYSNSNTTVNLVVKKANSITVNDSDISFDLGATGNITTVKVNSTPVENTTVSVIIDNKSIGTIDIINGSVIFSFANLGLSAGTHNVTFAYAGDDTYLADNAKMTVTVNAKNLGNLNSNTTKINGVTVNSVNKTFTLNLTNSSNASQIIDYTGEVAYTTTNADGVTTTGTINMINGKATVDATTLKGLGSGRNTVAFKLANNYTSSEAKVFVYASTVSTIINADNVSTNNATPITITGTVTNATEGNVKVNLKDAKNNTIATVIGNVAADGTFTVSFGNYANGVYTAEINYTSATGLSKASTKNVTVTVNGTAPTPVVGNVTTNLTINNNFTEAYGEGLNLTGKLTDANGNPIVGQHIALNLTNPANGASKIYWVTTDTNGEYQLQINLFVGSYTASASFAGFTTADNKTYYLPSGPANGTITVTNGTEPVDNRTATVLAFSNFSEKYGQALNFTGTLKTTNGTAIVGQKVAIELFNKAGQSKVYWRTTDTDGAVQLPIELFAGDYTFKCTFAGDSTYQPSNNQEGSITVTA